MQTFKVILTSASVDEILRRDNSNETSSRVLYKVVLAVESVDEILWCDHSNETSLSVLLHGTIFI